jgi:hypothetical protein
MPKSVAKKQKLTRKRNRKREARLRAKQKQDCFREEGSNFDFDAPGGVRMSDVLDQFVEPFEEHIDDVDAYRRLLMLGVLAWNAALMPESKQQQMVDDVIHEGLREESRYVQAACKGIVNQLVERKKMYFAEYTRPIIDFMVEDTGDNYHLTVTSVLT